MTRARGARLALPVGAATLVVLTPALARADAYIPFASSLIQATIALFVIVVLVEAAILRWALHTSMRAALWTSLLANALSTAVGLALALVTRAASAGVDALAVAGLFALSVALEAWVIGRRHPGADRPFAQDRRPVLASLAMNLASYALLLSVVGYLAWQADQMRREEDDRRMVPLPSSFVLPPPPTAPSH